MKAAEFAYWLQGYFEINDAGNAVSGMLTVAQVEIIKRHLALVFIHDIDPKAGDAAHQAKLNDAHAPSKPEPQAPLPSIGGTGPGGVVYRC